MKLITTSWDDGHPDDFKIAALLEKYKVQGTFYVPRSNAEHEVMHEDQIQLLSKHFEIGGHTLTHMRLTSTRQAHFEYEIKGSFAWLKELLSYEPACFCFPGGVLSANVVKQVREAGYRLFRSTELLSVEHASKNQVLATSFQLYEHGKPTYYRNLLKRAKFKNLAQWILSGSETELFKLADQLLSTIEKRGSGCLHLWGHSWEIEEYKLWNKLEKLLKHLSGYRTFSFVQNKDLI